MVERQVHLGLKAVYPHENPETYVLRERTVHVSLTYEGPARIVRTGDQFEHSDNHPVPFKATIRRCDGEIVQEDDHHLVREAKN